MNFENIKKILIETFQEKLTQKSKLYISISLGWVIFIGYLTWWNGLKSMSLDKSFRWDEWFWFGIIPATVPYLFYFIWKKKDTEDH
tara:strand:- start:201 stop:458 length:258 start_codon:yes stop_codon:yes gene_type:complete